MLLLDVIALFCNDVALDPCIQVSELAQLTEEDLQQCFVDAELLPPLLRSLRALGIEAEGAGGAGSPLRRRSTAKIPGGGISAGGDSPKRTLGSTMAGRKYTATVATNGSRQKDEGSEMLAARTPVQQLASLLQEHGLIKLLPLVRKCFIKLFSQSG